MFCVHCGNLTKKGYSHCPHCGLPPENSKKKRFSISWRWGLVIFIISAVLLSWNTDNLIEPIEGQLAALRANRMTEAYYGYMSKEFQNRISLFTFKELVRGLLTQSTRLHLNEKVLNNNIAKLKGNLQNLDQSLALIEYDLVKEGPQWKISNIALETKTAPGTGSSGATMGWLTPIDAQLRAFREKDYAKAYEETASNDFKLATPLEDFKKFVEKYPILTTHKNIIVKNQILNNDTADITIVLEPDREAVPVQYHLVREGTDWKIWNMNVTPLYSDAVLALMQDPTTMRKLVENFLKRTKADEIDYAYNSFTSLDFQKVTSPQEFRLFLQHFPMLANHDAITFKEPSLEGGTGKLIVNLFSENGSSIVEFTLGIEENAWKIWGIQVLRQTPESPLELRANPKLPATTPPPTRQSFSNRPIEEQETEKGSVPPKPGTTQLTEP